MGNGCRTTLVPVKFPTVFYGKMVEDWKWKYSLSSVVYKPRYYIKMAVIYGGFIYLGERWWFFFCRVEKNLYSRS